MRQIVFDTETTGIGTAQGHRLIEVGCVEMVNRRLTGKTFHYYVNPERAIDAEASNVHGIYDKDLLDKPLFRDIAQEFLAFVQGADLIAHNAKFDQEFIDHEFYLIKGDGWQGIEHYCKVIDTYQMSRKMRAGQKHSLDALVRYYQIPQRDRTFHGALLDAEILADVYLAMTGGQVGLALGQDDATNGGREQVRRVSSSRDPLPVLRASANELEAHQAKLAELDKKAEGGACLWRQLEPQSLTNDPTQS
jgi:DNA polymerase-3 subunit epsilon